MRSLTEREDEIADYWGGADLRRGQGVLRRLAGDAGYGEPRSRAAGAVCRP